MKEFDILEERKSKFKPSSTNMKIMKHVYDEYTDKQIEEMYAMLSGDGNFTYDLNLVVGDKITGKVAGETSTDYLFDIGYKDYLRVEQKKSETDALVRYANDEDSISQNTEIEILITEVSETPYIIRGSLSSLHKKDAYTDILKNSDEPIHATVLSSMPAGFNIEIYYEGFKIPAFMPNILAGVNKLTMEQGQLLIGKKIMVMIESFSSEKGTFIASRKKYLKTLIPNAVSKLKNIGSDKKPISYTGVVTGCAKFGIFVEFNEYLTGMIHKDNLSDEYKDKYQNLSAGSEINFFIKEITNDKLILTQTWKETIWDSIENNDIYDGIVDEVKNAGVMIRLDEETLGMIHLNEFSKLGIAVPKVGDTIKVRVSNVLKMERRIYLALVKN
jgi:ribosomal protein S1